jgi:hypothetical protein
MHAVVAQWHEVIGVAGMVMYLGSYFMLQTGTLRSNSATYCIANILAASLVMISLLHDFNLASALIQISWIAISTIGLFRMMFGSQPARRRRRRLAVVY